MTSETAIRTIVISLLTLTALSAQWSSFVKPRDFYPAGSGGFAIRTGDFNGDGNSDLVVGDYFQVGNANQNLRVLLGKPDGTFEASLKSSVAPRAGVIDIAVGDVNRDGKLDIVVAAILGSGSNTFTRAFLLLGNGTGTFRSPQQLDIPGVSLLALADLDADGNLDLVIAVGSSVAAIAVYLGHGDGSFENHTTLPIAGYPGPDIMIADF
jgi:hypothetical protein